MTSYARLHAHDVFDAATAFSTYRRQEAEGQRGANWDAIYNAEALAKLAAASADGFVSVTRDDIHLLEGFLPLRPVNVGLPAPTAAA